MGYAIRNQYSGDVYASGLTLQQARSFCGQRLLRRSRDLEGFRSDLAAGFILVYCAASAGPGYFGPGF